MSVELTTDEKREQKQRERLKRGNFGGDILAEEMAYSPPLCLSLAACQSD